jgi:hypothetical protein
MDTYQPLLQKLKARVEVRTLLLLIVLCACVLKWLVHSLMSAHIQRPSLTITRTNNR